MKPQPFFKPLLLLVLLVAAGSFSQQAMAQEDTCAVNVIHTYMNGRLIPWDSVEVRVCLPPCEYPYHYRIFKMYWPDTILSNCTTGVDEYVQDKEWGLSQNYPNPCLGESRVKLTTRTAGRVKLQVMDLQGRLCCQRTEMLPAGEHQLALTLPHSGVYFVQAETSDGRKVSKVLCTEGIGSGFDIRVASTSPQLVEKAEQGGEGLFHRTDPMQITAYVTHNGEVLSSAPTDINYNFDTNEVEHGEWLYPHGAVNFHFTEADTCGEFPLSGQTFKILVTSNVCQPFADYPLGSRVTFYDTTFQALQGPHFQQLSSTWQFNGWYKYRYYPAIERLCVCGMDDPLPPQGITSADDPALVGYDLRTLRITSCDVATVGQCLSDTECYGEEMMVNSHCDTSCYAYDLSGSCCFWPEPFYPNTLILVNDMQEIDSYINCSCPTPPEIDFDCHSLVVLRGTIAGDISILDVAVAHQDSIYVITLYIRIGPYAVDGTGYTRGVVINKINDIADAQFEIVKTYSPDVFIESFSGCLSDTLSGDTVVIQQHNGPVLHVQHRLTLNCAVTSVEVEASCTNNTIDIVYHVDGNVSDDCVCPTQLEYWVGELPEGNHIVNFWLNGQIIHQENYFW